MVNFDLCICMKVAKRRGEGSVLSWIKEAKRACRKGRIRAFAQEDMAEDRPQRALGGRLGFGVYPTDTGDETNHSDTGFPVVLWAAELWVCPSNYVASTLDRPQESSAWTLKAWKSSAPLQEETGYDCSEADGGHEGGEPCCRESLSPFNK